MGFSNSPLSSPEHYLARPPGMDGSPPRHQAFQQRMPRITEEEQYLPPSILSSHDVGLMQPPPIQQRSSYRGMYNSNYLPNEGNLYRSEMYPNGMMQSEREYYPSLNHSEMLYDDYQPMDWNTSASMYPPMQEYTPSMMQTEYDLNYSMPHLEGDSRFNQSSRMNTSLLPPSDYNYRRNSFSKPMSLYHSEDGMHSNRFSSVIDSTLQFVEPIQEEVDINTAMTLRKQGKVEDALRVLNQLREEPSPAADVYIELIRIYTTLGDYFSAEKAAEEGLHVHRNNEDLLDRLIGVEEKIGNADKIFKAIELLMVKPAYKMVKLIADACMHLCKMNSVYRVQHVYDSLISRDLFKQGNLLLGYAVYLYRSVSIPQAIHFIEQSLGTFSKYGPMWFTLFQYLEAQIIQCWDYRSVKERVQLTRLYSFYDQAVNTMSTELRWKVYYTATQMILRTITHLRLVLHSNVRSSDLCHL